MLETLEKSNIKKMGVEEPKEEAIGFKPEISQKEVESMIEIIQTWRKDRNWVMFGLMADAMRELNIPIPALSREEIESIKDNLDEYQNSGKDSDFIKLLLFIQDFGLPIDINLDDTAGIIRLVQYFKNRERWHDFIYTLKVMKNLNFPVSILPQDKRELLKVLQDAKKNQSSYDFSLIAKDMQDLGIEIEISEEEIKTMIRELDAWRTINIYIFADMAKAMRCLLRSYKIPQKSLPSLTTPIPEQKKF